MSTSEGHWKWTEGQTVKDEMSVLEIQLPGIIKRVRPKRRYLEVAKEDMREIGAREDEVLTKVYGESAVVTSSG